MNLRFVVIILFALTLTAQIVPDPVTEMAKFYFVSESSDLSSGAYNPAALGFKQNVTGLAVSYDFENENRQGNANVMMALGNWGMSIHDIFKYDSLRIRDYSLRIAAGNSRIVFGTTTRFISVNNDGDYSGKFLFDAGVIVKPDTFISVGFVARNIGEEVLSDVSYERNYTVGVGLNAYEGGLSLYADADFKDGDNIEDMVYTVGTVVSSGNFFKLRGGVIFNYIDPDEYTIEDYINFNTNFKSFVGATLMVGESVNLTGVVRFDEDGRRESYSAILSFPLFVKPQKPGNSD